MNPTVELVLKHTKNEYEKIRIFNALSIEKCATPKRYYYGRLPLVFVVLAGKIIWREYQTLPHHDESMANWRPVHCLPNVCTKRTKTYNVVCALID
jgi:hypothetical protein